MFVDTQLTQKLRVLLDECGCTLPDSAVRLIITYIMLLVKWNSTHNLTAVRKPDDMLTRHIIDSLVVLPFIHGERILDVGSGPGLPGIPLAIALPEKHFVLLDANGKKVSFMRQAVMELGLENVSVVQSRVNFYRSTQPFNSIISRAFSSLIGMLEGASHLCAPGGKLLAMKGGYPVAELEALPTPVDVHTLAVPGLEQRHLVAMQPL